MQIKFEFATYNDALDAFSLDDTIYVYELDDEEVQTYNTLKSNDLNLYNWFKESDFFINWIKEDVYPNQADKKIVICDINDITFRRWFFFKVTSADTHYEYFKKLFNISHELDWQDREDVGKEILEKLVVERRELIIDLVDEPLSDETSEESLEVQEK